MRKATFLLLPLSAVFFIATTGTPAMAQMHSGSEPAEPAPPAAAPQAPGGPGASADMSQSQKLQDQIDAARKAGKNVNVAESEKKRGDAALAAGYKSEAAQHYERAQKQLSNIPTGD
jgi:Fe-S oxidoreductase